jgi:hypothetical protein
VLELELQIRSAEFAEWLKAKIKKLIIYVKALDSAPNVSAL